MNDPNSTCSAYRIIDASFNRAMEGLRVVEEFARMHANDAWLSSQLKNCRHQLATSISTLGTDRLTSCRDILNDVGTQIQTDSEYERSGLEQIVRANFGRVLQSLRSIEEYSKMVAPEISQDIEKLRYETYSLEKAMTNSMKSNQSIASPAIYILTDTRGSESEFESLVKELVAAKVEFIQLRDKSLDDESLVTAGKKLGEWTRESSTRWIMNDRADLALLANADGVHLGQTDLSVASAQRIVGSEKIIGVSTHNIDQARQAVLDGANYIGVGPVFPSQTKSFESFASEQFVTQVAEEIALPAFAIGGISFDNVERIAESGLHRIAVCHAVINSTSPTKAVQDLRKALSQQASILAP